MRLFNMIALEASAQCNRTCWFCPNTNNKRPEEYLDMLIIEKLASSLGDLHYSGRVELYMYNEPLKDERLLDIISIFRKMAPKSCIMISTNCDYINEKEDILKLYNAGLNQAQLNIYGNIKQYQKIESIIKSIEWLMPGNIYTNTGHNKKIYSLENKIEVHGKVGRFMYANRAGNIDTGKIIVEPLSKMCTRPFRSMQINWRGEVVLCCCDYKGEVVMGNIKTENVRAIWENEKYSYYRSHLIRKDRRLPLCSKCDFDGGAYPHMVKKEDYNLEDDR